MNNIESQLTYFYIICVCELTYLILIHYAHSNLHKKQSMHDEPEVTLNALCSVHDLFMLKLDKVSF